MTKKIKLNSGDLVKIKNINREDFTKIFPFCIKFKKGKEECEICFQNELDYVLDHGEAPYDYIDLNQEILLYLREDSVLTGKHSQEYFKTQLWETWHKFILNNDIVYLPEEFLTYTYMEIMK